MEDSNLPSFLYSHPLKVEIFNLLETIGNHYLIRTEWT